MDDLNRLQDWLAPLLSKLNAGERRLLAREVAKRARTSTQQNMAAQQSPDGQRWEPRKHRSRDARGNLRQGPMFKKLRLARHLRTHALSHEAVVEFVGRAARIARVHHYGLRDRVSEGGAQYQYPARELLGLSDEQMGAITDLILDHLSSFS